MNTRNEHAANEQMHATVQSNAKQAKRLASFAKPAPARKATSAQAARVLDYLHTVKACAAFFGL